MSGLPDYLRCLPADELKPRVRNLFSKIDGRKSTVAFFEREAMPILAIVGPNGSGKTFCAVYTVARALLDGVMWECDNLSHAHMHARACPARRRGACKCEPAVDGVTSGERLVLSNLPLTDPATGEDHPRYRKLRSYRDLVTAEHCDVLLDEATAVADAQEHQSLPAPVRNVLSQQRKRDVRLIWTAVDYSNANKRIRQATQGVVYCTGGAKVKSSNQGQTWRETRRMRWALYETADFEVFTATQRMDGVPLSMQFIWRPGHIVERMYDSQRYVDLIGTANEGGICLGCGGRRTAPKCTCPHDPDSVPEGVIEEVGPRGQRERRVEVIA